MPAPLVIDFATAQRGSEARSWIVLGVGVACTVAALVSYRSIALELDEVDAQARVAARKLGAEQKREVLDPARLQALSQRIAASNRVLQALDQPWFQLLADIEAAITPGIVLLAFEPDAAQGSVRLSAEARDLEALSRYLDRLAALDSLQDVRMNQQELREARGLPVLRFSVSARWGRPA